MTVATQNAAPSTLDAVLAQVRDAFSAMADATTIMVGKQYLEQTIGAPPRVLFVPEQKGQLGPPLELGDAASIVHSCDVYIRAADTDDDLDRFAAAYALMKRVMGCLAVAATGRIVWGSFDDESPTDAPAYGCDLAFSFTYTSAVRHDELRWRLDPATADSATWASAIPPGQPGTVDTVTAVAVPAED